jgi:hypothetical protein
MSARTAVTALVASGAALLLAACGSAAAPGRVTTGAPSSAASSSPTTSTSRAPATNTGSAEDDSFVMPNEVGKILQAAQDDIQRVSGNPIFFTSSTDATGAGRHQILDRDWQVCTQSIPAGTKVGPDARIDFGVVRTSETCP